MRSCTLAALAILLGGCHLLFPFSAVSSDAAVDDVPAPERSIPADGPALPDEALPDMALPDKALPDGPSTAPCINAVTHKTLTADMLICKGATNRDQCGAGAICNKAAGWKICTASQYLSRNGMKVNPKVVAWIAGCVREGGAVTAPLDKVCGKCLNEGGTSLYSAWICSTGSTSTGYSIDWVGVATYPDCRRVGANLAQNEAYWYTLPTVSGKLYTVCCK